MTELASPVVVYLRRSRLTLTVATLEGRRPSAWKKADRRWSVERLGIKSASLTKRFSPLVLFGLLFCILPAFGFAENLYWDAYEGWADSELDVFWGTVLAILIALFTWSLRRPTLRLLTAQGELFIPLSRFERALGKRLVDELKRSSTRTDPVHAAAPSFIQAPLR